VAATAAKPPASEGVGSTAAPAPVVCSRYMYALPPTVAVSGRALLDVTVLHVYAIDA
jgi:hypothetical protein